MLHFTYFESKMQMVEHQNQFNRLRKEAQPILLQQPGVQARFVFAMDTINYASLLSVISNGVYIRSDATAPNPITNYKDDAYEVSEAEPIFLDIPLSEELQLYTMQLSEEFNVPYDLLFAIMFVESTFRPHVISRTRDYGIMQINRVNHGWLREQHGITDFLCAEQSILSGTIMISALIERYEDLHKALMAYNMGSAGARRRWKQGIYTSTYSKRVIEIMNSYIQQRKQILLEREKETIEHY